jgi:hypothetical protein
LLEVRARDLRLTADEAEAFLPRVMRLDLPLAAVRAMEPQIYLIRIEGQLAARWQEWFDGMRLSWQNGETLLGGPVADQTALHGLLAKVRDLGLPLISVERCYTDPAATGEVEQLP